MVSIFPFAICPRLGKEAQAASALEKVGLMIHYRDCRK